MRIRNTVEKASKPQGYSIFCTSLLFNLNKPRLLMVDFFTSWKPSGLEAFSTVFRIRISVMWIQNPI